MKMNALESLNKQRGGGELGINFITETLTRRYNAAAGSDSFSFSETTRVFVSFGVSIKSERG